MLLFILFIHILFFSFFVLSRIFIIYFYPQFLRKDSASRFLSQTTDTHSLLNCENPRGRPSSALRMPRSVNAPPPLCYSGKPTIFFSFSYFFTCRLSATSFFLLVFFVFRSLLSVLTDTEERIRSAENVVDDVDLHLSLSTISSSSFPLLPLFSTSVFLLLYIGEPPLNSLGH